APGARCPRPAERTCPRGRRVLGRLREIAFAAGAVAATGATSEAGTSAPASRHATELTELLGQTAAELGHPEATSAQLIATATFFSGTVGAVNAELFTQWGPQFEPHGAERFTQQTRLLTQAVGV